MKKHTISTATRRGWEMALESTQKKTNDATVNLTRRSHGTILLAKLHTPKENSQKKESSSTMQIITSQ